MLGRATLVMVRSRMSISPVRASRSSVRCLDGWAAPVGAGAAGGAGRGSVSCRIGGPSSRAGVSRRAVYLHFASRAELLTELFGHVSEREGLAASLQPVWDAQDAAAALDQWARHLARFHPRILAVARAIQRVRRDDPDAAAH